MCQWLQYEHNMMFVLMSNVWLLNLLHYSFDGTYYPEFTACFLRQVMCYENCYARHTYKALCCYNNFKRGVLLYSGGVFGKMF